MQSEVSCQSKKRWQEPSLYIHVGRQVLVCNDGQLSRQRWVRLNKFKKVLLAWVYLYVLREIAPLLKLERLPCITAQTRA